MRNLSLRRCAVLMHPVRQRFEICYRIRGEVRLVDESLSVFGGRAIGDSCHGRAAFCHAFMKCRKPFGNNSAFTHTFIGCRFNKAVAQFQRPDSKGRKGF